jgi:lipopolysaccharide transport system permease protein
MIGSFITDMIRSRELLFELVRRDLTSKYRDTIIGFFWNVINPLVMLAVYTFVFSVIFKVKFGARNVPGNFAIYLFCGLVPWNAFAEAFSRCTGVIITHSDLVKKTVLPLESLPCYTVISSVVTELIGVGILLVAATIALRTVSPYLVLIPLLMILQAFFSLGLGMFFASFTVFFRDVRYFVNVLLTVWFFMTPILYPISMMPEKIRVLGFINPMTLLVTMFRDVVLEGRIPELWMLGAFAGCAFVFFLGGLYFFRRTKAEFADVI